MNKLIGDARRRKELELSQQYWDCYRLSHSRDAILAEIDRIKASGLSSFDKNLRIPGLRERLGHVWRELNMARVRAEHAAGELGVDANVSQFFAEPKIRPSAPVKRGSAPVRRGAISLKPTRTVPNYICKVMVPGK